MRAATVIAVTITTLLASAGTITLAVAHRNTSRELAELKTAQPVLAACPIPPLGSPQRLIIWRTTDAAGGEEIICQHGRIRAADPRAVGPARPRSAS